MIHPEPSVSAQAERLVELGVPELGGITAGQLREHAAALRGAALPADPGAGRPVLAVHPSFVSTARLTPLLSRGGRAGFVVVDMSDLDEFTPTDDVRLPDAPLYLVGDVTRDDDMLGWTPTDAHAELARRGRTPLTISEGVSWLLQEPEMLEPGKCFMCIGSRKRKTDGGLDSRTPALWISGGTGRDGRENRGAPKLGWCWANNHHTWLGFASAAGRVCRDSAQAATAEA
ncbi:hypothetical protein A6048_12065 [Dietzia psychralcaliphila]|uniref:Uncharacterized protein n=1 Tax=Dietzia psychralcaliphila TaxID=139021 RepID=A0AAD0JSL4_9ACTN|nr:DUF5701 family protein [Dietzia psychralcaliphila]AWH96109.1 hypothetical protein A6048_12065 [Dietzia psychralcaliphila]PTM90837.1 hypothetical protein C8N39_101595 [Dietzia psychralcaliphila]